MKGTRFMQNETRNNNNRLFRFRTNLEEIKLSMGLIIWVQAE